MTVKIFHNKGHFSVRLTAIRAEDLVACYACSVQAQGHFYPSVLCHNKINLKFILNRGKLMKKIKYKKSIGLLIVAAGMATTIAQAVPWCHKGTIVQIADVHWGESSILANYPGGVPGGLPPVIYGNVDTHITFTSTNQYANSFAGGGGSFGGYSVPGSGQVLVHPYAPHNYTNAPSLYSTSEGVKFKLKKCYTIPPLVEVFELEKFVGPVLPGEPGGPVVFEPLERIEEMRAYWERAER